MAQKTATYTAGVAAGTYTNADVTVSSQGVVTAIANGSAGAVVLGGDVTGASGANVLSNVQGNPLQTTLVAQINHPVVTEFQQLTVSLRPFFGGVTPAALQYWKFERTGRCRFADNASLVNLFDRFTIPADFQTEDWSALVEIKLVGSQGAADGGGAFMLARHQAFKNLSGVLSLEGVGSTQLSDFNGNLNPSAVTFGTTNAPQSIDFYIQSPASVSQRFFRFWYTLIICNGRT